MTHRDKGTEEAGSSLIFHIVYFFVVLNPTGWEMEPSKIHGRLNFSYF